MTRKKRGLRYHHPIWDVLRAQGRMQTWAAQTTGYSYGHIRSMSCGRMPTSKPFAEKLASVLGVDLQEVLANHEAERVNQGAA